MLTPQYILDFHSAMIIDLFAGGGGASTGIEQAVGRHVDVAVNHNADAIGMHEMNHPQTRHYRADVWEVDPLSVTHGRRVGLLHASPDCTHHSQALGGQPRSQEIRSLAWIVHRWGGKTKPDVISVENVEQMLQWSPLVAKRDPATGRVITLDKVVDAYGKLGYRVANPGEVVARGNQFLVPCKKRVGHNWRRFVEGLRAMGYKVEWRVICNADLGAHSTRTRLYMVARCDGLPIVWPESTHSKKASPRRKLWRPASDCIDWSIPAASIFGRKKELVSATLRRVSHGLRKFVLNSANPFVVQGAARILVQTGYGERKGQAPRSLDLGAPLGTVVAGGAKHALVSGYLVQAGHGEGQGGGKRWSHGANDISGPMGTITASGGGQSVACAFMVQANGGFNAVPARDLSAPMSTVTTTGSQQQLLVASLAEPGVGGDSATKVRYQLSDEDLAGALRCAEFLKRYPGDAGSEKPKCETDRDEVSDLLSSVTVWIKGDPWVIVDLALRMLAPRELYNAQDFPADYVIDRTASGKALTKTAQVRMAGNSVSPLPMRQIVAANYQEFSARRLAA